MKKKHKKVSVVVINYNGEDLLKKFFPSVINHTNKDISEIYVIDNCSSDKSVEFLNNKYPEVNLIKNKKNYGYAGGYNRGLKNIKSEYVVLLNNDVELTKNWLDIMIEKMELNNSIGSCQPKILSYTNKKKFEYAGACGGYLDLLGYPYCRGRIFDFTEEDHGQYDDDKEIFWSSGACIMLKNKLFKKIGGFDESFFAHMEEIDLCWRLKAEGYTNYCFPQSKVYHLGGGTLNYDNSKKTFLNFRNNLFMLAKNENRLSLIFKIPLRLIFDLVAAMRFLIYEKSLKNFISIIKAYLYLIIRLPSLLISKRKIINKYSKESNRIIPIDFFLKRKKRFTDL
tara:strand:+ start:3024 stop:4040 length:1017 start_codon:yes stop_codon:yes gene_type:complete